MLPEIVIDCGGKASQKPMKKPRKKAKQAAKHVNVVIGPIHVLPETVEDAHATLPPGFPESARGRGMANGKQKNPKRHKK